MQQSNYSKEQAQNIKATPQEMDAWEALRREPGLMGRLARRGKHMKRDFGTAPFLSLLPNALWRTRARPRLYSSKSKGCSERWSRSFTTLSQPQTYTKHAR